MKLVHVRRCLHKFSTQHTFTCATSRFSERKWDLVCHIWMLLTSYHASMASFVGIIYLMGDMGERDQCGLFNVRFHNVFHNLTFNKPTCVVCYTIHNGGHYLLEHCRCLSYLSFTSSVEACLMCFHVPTSSTF